MNELAWLQEWYKKQCNGKWEHQFGVEITTLDNPGWHVKIDGINIRQDPNASMHFDDEGSAAYWIKCSLEAGIFKGFSDPHSLELIIRTFRTWIDT